MTILRSDESDEPSIDRLDGHARQLFYELLRTERSPVAMIGSGLSIVYGGVSWRRSVELCLDFTALRLETAIDLTDGILRDRLRRFASAIEAFQSSKALDASSDKYVALDLCSEALATLDPLPKTQRGECLLTDDRPEGMPSFRAFMAKVYRDDTLFVRLTLIRRFFVDRKLIDRSKPQTEIDRANALRRAVLELPDDKLQRLAVQIYSMKFLGKLARRTKDARKTFNEVRKELKTVVMKKGWVSQAEILPMDRRSLLCLFLSEFSAQERRDFLAAEIRKLKKPLAPAAAVPAVRPILDPIRALQHWHGVDRYITLNFDFQLEHSLLLDDVRSIFPPPAGLESAIRDSTLSGDGESGAFTRRFRDGLAGSTDIYSETAVARLYEFALNSSDFRAQILHLHGRADLPDTMILTDADNNRQYRRNRHARTTLEQALDVTLTGNPVLFVGIGLSEAEITRALRELVSRGHATPNNPAFAIMPIFDGETSAWRQQMAAYRQYGIHLIAAGLPSLRKCDGLADTLERVDELLARAKALQDDPTATLPAARDLQKACLDLPLVEELWLDRIAFKTVSHFLGGALSNVPAHQLESLRDYLERLKEKLGTLANVMCLRELRVGSYKYNTERRLSSPYGERGELISDPEKTPKTGFLRIRDEGFWQQPANGLNTRHIGVLPTARSDQMDPEAERYSEKLREIAKKIDADTNSIVTCFAPLGAGKGEVTRVLATLYAKRNHPSLVVNCNFGIEFESVIIRIQRFLWFNSKHPPGEPGPPILDRVAGITSVLSPLQNGAATGRPTIVLAGIERLVDGRSEPVAPELDLLFSQLLSKEFVDSGFQLVLVASDGCQNYIEPLLTERKVERGRDWTRLTWKPEGEAATGFLGHLTRSVRARCDVESRQSLWRSVEQALRHPSRANVPNSARSAALTAVLRIVLERWHEIAFKPEEAGADHRLQSQLDLTILGEMAFVGMPLKYGFLTHLSNVRDLCADITALKANTTRDKLTATAFDKGMKKEIRSALSRLEEFGLVIHVVSFKSDERVVLHRSVMAEVRERYGVRSGDEMLSNSFSLTLSLSMPTDLVVADWDIHRRLKLTVGRLRGAWKDTPHEPAVARALTAIRKALAGGNGVRFDAFALQFEELYSRLDRAIRIARSPMDVNIRAAAGVIRGFFAAASLVALLPSDQERGDGQLGEFEEHKRRLGHIVRYFRESQTAVEDVASLLAEIKTAAPGLKASHLAAITKSVKTAQSPFALYGGEIIWLLNERAVIALLQGDLYEAQRGFRDADQANRIYRSVRQDQAWRRIEINRCLVRIERGRIVEARARLEEVEREIKGRLEPRSRTEDKLTLPLATSYLGLCEHLEGKFPRAKDLFDDAIRGLEKTQQQRALAVTYVRRASLFYGIAQSVEAEADIRRGLAAAEAGRQIDIVWRARLTQLGWSDATKDHRMTETIFREAQRYAHLMELPRVAVQALRGEAEFRVKTDDLEAASIKASEAMRVATRYGMTLQRIALRVLMGNILLKRGDRSGHYLLQRALAHADRVGYQLQVDRAQQAILQASKLDRI